MGFWPSRDKDKLYKQWLEHSDLPLDAIPKKEGPKERPMRMGREEPRREESASRWEEPASRWEEPAPRREEPAPRWGAKTPRPMPPEGMRGINQRLLILYILLGVAIIIVCVGVVVLLGQVF